MSSSKANNQVDASDDIDDLDDILDEFNTTQKQSSALPIATSSTLSTGKGDTISHEDGLASAEIPTQAAATGSTALTSEENGEETEEEMNERFARELAVGMEALMKGLGGPDGALPDMPQADPSASDGGNENLFNEEEMMKQFEQMMADMGLGGMAGMEGFPGAAPGTSAPSVNPISTSSTSAIPPSAPPANFQDAIKSTMSRLRESDASASSSTGAAADGMDMEKLMAALGGAEGLEGEEGLAKMLESMMGELMSKEILYDPLKELRDKYPGYLANPPATLSSEDRSRYEAQFRIVTQVISIFDDKKFETGTEAEKSALKARVQTLMNEMQDNGAPPAEIVGDLPPELENMPGLGNDENCTII